ncbi:Verru_Chthon cassette protein C [Terrimicrobium sacchariphilum]|uniref:Verru_Chthon cassette protein C n=1 Tax=Terrimicrobium sacchariphilum TaxID=690879 RepID=A0A146G5H7_TERSA|nr:Verru_Chthon cassette protein C [Terrimicrobium sacchariphilum]GAT32234.1 Verru_Chthon cassette protein C [Terrimicrobium sacchariphilum]
MARAARAFTFIELLVAIAVLMIVMVVLLQITGKVGEIWRSSSGKISAFQNARAAFSTLNLQISRATLNAYNDYVDSSGQGRTEANAGTFVPTRFARASDLHFLSGPAAQIVPGADAAGNPGDAIFFQAPLGETDDTQLASLNRALNSTGFYIQYGEADASLLPNWLKSLFPSDKRFRLVQFVQPTQELGIYTATAAGSYPAAPSSTSSWLSAFKTPVTAQQPRARVLAEDVALLIIRPRLSPGEEEAVAGSLGSTYNNTTRGSILSPNYHYDSRAWQSGYPSGRVPSTGSTLTRPQLMRNQLPPIVDVAMVCVDRRSVARLGNSSSTPPAELKVPSTLFTDSSRLDADLAAYSQQLSNANIRHRVFRSAVEIQGAKWSNN